MDSSLIHSWLDIRLPEARHSIRLRIFMSHPTAGRAAEGFSLGQYGYTLSAGAAAEPHSMAFVVRSMKNSGSRFPDLHRHRKPKQVGTGRYKPSGYAPLIGAWPFVSFGALRKTVCVSAYGMDRESSLKSGCVISSKDMSYRALQWVCRFHATHLHG